MAIGNLNILIYNEVARSPKLPKAKIARGE